MAECQDVVDLLGRLKMQDWKMRHQNAKVEYAVRDLLYN